MCGGERGEEWRERGCEGNWLPLIRREGWATIWEVNEDLLVPTVPLQLSGAGTGE